MKPETLLANITSPGAVILEIGSLSLRWYGLLIAIAVLIGLNISNRLSKSRGIPNGLINDLLPILVLSSLVGARLYYVIFSWKYYQNNLFEILAIWKGGIAIHGALISGSIAILLFCKNNKQSFWNLLDTLLPSVALGQAIGRWGNFFNNEAFGIPTDLPWKLSIPYNLRPYEFSNYEYFHPTFLYESIWDLLIFICLINIFKKGVNGSIRLTKGTISCLYILSYGIGRFFIEGLRADPLCLGGVAPFCEGGLRIAQIASMLFISLGAFGIWRIYVRKKELPDYIYLERSSE